MKEVRKGRKNVTDLKVVSVNGQLVTDSRDVAEMVGKRHDHLLADIRKYIEILDSQDFGSRHFFISSYYINSQNKQMPCYLLTRKGCDMVANKLTGEKGVLFTAAYVTKFEEMEKQLKPQSIEDLIILQAQSMKDVKQRLETVEKKQENITEVLSLNPTEWRKKVNGLINRIARNRGGFDAYRDVRNESYQLLEERARCQLSIRLTNKRRKMALEGVPKSKIDKLTKMDAIADDARLTEIYLAIVKEMAIQNGVEVKEAN